MVMHCAKSFLWSTKTWGTSLTVINNPEGMNEAGPITDLATCKEAIRTAVQKRSFSQRSSLIFTWLTERGDQQRLVTEALFQVKLRMKVA